MSAGVKGMPVSIYLDKDIRKILDMMCKHKGVSRSNLINHFLELILQKRVY